jgi:hypothetical protein
MLTHAQFGWIVFGLLCAIAVLTAVWVAFRLAFAKGEQEPFLTWVKKGADTDARAGNQCTVAETIKDTELEGAVIELVDESCEDGLPHTVDADRIRMTKTVWNGDRREDILRHERIHLLQRRDPLTWGQFYKEKWGYTDFTKVAPAGVPDDAVVRSNPDTADSPWVCWGNRYWFVPVYRDTKNPKIRDTETRVWDARLSTWSDPPREWISLFCEEGRCPYQLEHPHEISAEILSDIKEPWKTPAALLLREFQQNLSPEG